MAADSKDENGHYCGQDARTGLFVRSEDTVVGFCGPDCEHCEDFRVYAIQDGVWVCAACYEPSGY